MTTHTLIQMEELPLEKTLKLSNFYTWGKAEGHREQVGKAGTQAPLLPAASIRRRPSVRRKQHPRHL